MALIDWFSNPGNLIAVISLIMSAIAIYTAWITQKRQVEIEEIREKDRQKDMRKANLVARLKNDDGRRLLVIENKGPSEARDITILLNGRPLSEYQGFVQQKEEIRSVGAFSSFHYLMVLVMGMDLSFEIAITWVDDSEETGHYNTTLTY